MIVVFTISDSRGSLFLDAFRGVGVGMTSQQRNAHIGLKYKEKNMQNMTLRIMFEYLIRLLNIVREYKEINVSQ
jgi:hypothetical protein